MAILVTGGAGYIGSHTCVELLKAGYEIVVADNFSNSRPDVMERIREITGIDFPFYHVDLLDKEALDIIFSENKLEAVIHLAGIKVKEDRSEESLWQYHQDVIGTVILCEVMEKHQVKKLVFRSFTEVYGQSEKNLIQEDSILGATNPYGRTKQLIEEMLRDLYVNDQEWSVAFLRYGRAVEAHESIRIGGNLEPKSYSLLSELYEASVVRKQNNSIHVVDVAIEHRKAFEKVMYSNGVAAYNLGWNKDFCNIEITAQGANN